MTFAVQVTGRYKPIIYLYNYPLHTPSLPTHPHTHPTALQRETSPTARKKTLIHYTPRAPKIRPRKSPKTWKQTGSQSPAKRPSSAQVHPPSTKASRQWTHKTINTPAEKSSESLENGFLRRQRGRGRRPRGRLSPGEVLKRDRPAGFSRASK